MNEKSVKTVRKNRILEFLGWMLGVLGLLFVALAFAYSSQDKVEVREGEKSKLQDLSKMVNTQTASMDAALKQIDARFSEYIKGDIASPADLDDKVKPYRQLINDGIDTIKASLNHIKVVVDSKLYDLLLARYESSLTDKTRMQEYLTGKVNCTEAMKQTCCEDLIKPPSPTTATSDPTQPLIQKIGQMKNYADDIIEALEEVKSITNYEDIDQKKDRLNKDEYKDFRSKMQTIERKANDIKSSY